MPWGLKRYYGTDGLHFITCSCYQRRQLIGTPERCDLLLDIFERMRLRYRFVVVGYVVMPEHFHLVMSEPEVGTPSVVMQAIKLGFVRRVLGSGFSQRCSGSEENDPTSRAKSAREMGHPGLANHIWQRRFYDFNLWSQRKEVEKLRYMHRNPVERGLVERPEDWRWSSFRAYAFGDVGTVRVADWSSWERRIRSRVS
jgi:putative transposase